MRMGAGLGYKERKKARRRATGFTYIQGITQKRRTDACSGIYLHRYAIAQPQPKESFATSIGSVTASSMFFVSMPLCC